MDIQEALRNRQDDVREVTQFSQELYNMRFAEHFQSVNELYRRLKSKTAPLTDSELEDILTVLPLELFTVAELLNALKLEYEVNKLQNKERRQKLKVDVTNKYHDDAKLSRSEFQDIVETEVLAGMTAYDVISAAYATVISRVESEISFTRELIMSAKKLWDARRSAEQVMPVSPVEPNPADLPNYDSTGYDRPRSYITG